MRSHFLLLGVAVFYLGCATEPPKPSVPPGTDETARQTQQPDDARSLQPIYESLEGTSCVSSDVARTCKIQIPDIGKKYWRFVLDRNTGSILKGGVYAPGFWRTIGAAVKTKESVVAQSFYAKTSAQKLEVPISAVSYVNGISKGDAIVVKPAGLSQWNTGSRLSNSDVEIASFDTLVVANTSQFVALAQGAIHALAMVDAGTAIILAVPGVSQVISAANQFEQAANKARNVNQGFPVIPQTIHPQYIKHIDVRARRPDGSLSTPGETLYRVLIEPRDSLFVNSLSDEVLISNIRTYKPTETASFDSRTDLVSVLDAAAKTGATGVISWDDCNAVFRKAEAMGFNEADQALATFAWLDQKGWNTSFDKRDPEDLCYSKIATLLAPFNQTLLVKTADLNRNRVQKEIANKAQARQLPELALGELFTIFKGRDSTSAQALSYRRFAKVVQVDSSEKSAALNAYFNIELHSGGSGLTSGALAAMFQPGADNPMVISDRKNCFQTISPSTSTTNLKMVCLSVKNPDGILEPYRMILSFDQSILDQPGSAVLKALRFEKVAVNSGSPS
jgi:hypothetical protein